VNKFQSSNPKIHAPRPKKFLLPHEEKSWAIFELIFKVLQDYMFLAIPHRYPTRANDLTADLPVGRQERKGLCCLFYLCLMAKLFLLPHDQKYRAIFYLTVNHL
jgi:hypothetical protein